MGTKDGSNRRETTDCDREADILPGMAAGLLPSFEFKVYQRRMAKRKPERALVHTRRRSKVWQIFKTDAGLPTVQYADDFGDLVFLKQANRGYACGALIEAGASVM
jgi:hypothetical protein